MAERLVRAGRVSPVMDRVYFKSIYTNDPDATSSSSRRSARVHSDEPVETLGQALMLPPWLERHRPEIESQEADHGACVAVQVGAL